MTHLKTILKKYYVLAICILSVTSIYADQSRSIPPPPGKTKPTVSIDDNILTFIAIGVLYGKSIFDQKNKIE